MANSDYIEAPGGSHDLSRMSDETFYVLGIACSNGRSASPDFVAAHKWFNLAAMLGNKDAIRMRIEIASEMSQAEIAAAQRAAREWLTTH